MAEKKYDVIGKRYDIKNIGKVTGEEIYSVTSTFPVNYILLSSVAYAHAEIKSIDYREVGKIEAICTCPDDAFNTLHND